MPESIAHPLENSMKKAGMKRLLTQLETGAASIPVLVQTNQVSENT